MLFFHEDKESGLSSRENPFGFTSLEIDHFLGNREAMSHIIKVIPKDQSKMIYCSEKEFQELFAVTYTSHLKFASYKGLKEVLHNCPFILKYSSLGEENRTLGKRYRQEISSGEVADMVIAWIDPRIGYGAFAGRDLEKGCFVGEYTGIVRRLYLMASRSQCLLLSLSHPLFFMEISRRRRLHSRK